MAGTTPTREGAGGQNDDRLLQSSSSIWHTQHSDNPPTATGNSRRHFSPGRYDTTSRIASNASLASATAFDPHEAAATSDSDSDFEYIGTELPSQSDASASVDQALSPSKSKSTSKSTLFASLTARSSTASGNQAGWDTHTEEEDDWDAVSGASDSDSDVDMDPANDYDGPEWHQAGQNADAADLAGPGEHGKLECNVTKPQKEGEGTQNVYISYLVVTDTDFKSFQATHQTVRRRYTDFVFLYKTLLKEYPQCAVPPLPDKHNMSYVRGDRFGPDFTARRAHSLARFLKRLTLHPVLRRAVILTLFLESSDWNATMRSRPSRGSTLDPSSTPTSALETWTDSFLNAFTKPHKADRRFTDVEARARKLDEDLLTVSKTVARVAKREADLESDYSDLATQFHKLAALEPGLTDPLTAFAAALTDTSAGWKGVKEHTDQDYLGSLKDMEAYGASLKALLKTREQKQLDFEGLTDYLNKAALERDSLASHTSSMSASGFLRQKIEDVRGVDHEQARRERQRRLEVQIQRLQVEVEGAKKTSEAFDEEVVKEVGDFERIKSVEFRDALEGLAAAEVAFLGGSVAVWEGFVRELEGVQAGGGGGEGVGG